MCAWQPFTTSPPLKSKMELKTTKINNPFVQFVGVGEDFHFKGQGEFKISTGCNRRSISEWLSTAFHLLSSHSHLSFSGLWILGNVWSLLKLQNEWEIPSAASNISSSPLLIKMFKDILDTLKGFSTGKQNPANSSEGAATEYLKSDW